MAHLSRKAPNPPVRAVAFTLTPQACAIVQRLGTEATDALGRTIGSSAALRAVLSWVDQQGAPWVREHIVPLVAQELATGLTWGAIRKRKGGPT